MEKYVSNGEAKLMAENSKTELLKKLQSYNFAAYDMLLYLDVNSNDKKAFEIFKDLVMKTKVLEKEYEEKYGPLCAYNSVYSNSFNWLKGPWPWEKEANS